MTNRMKRTKIVAVLVNMPPTPPMVDCSLQFLVLRLLTPKSSYAGYIHNAWTNDMGGTFIMENNHYRY